jgi:hypothetical protein
LQYKWQLTYSTFSSKPNGKPKRKLIHNVWNYSRKWPTTTKGRKVFEEQPTLHRLQEHKQNPEGALITMLPSPSGPKTRESGLLRKNDLKRRCSDIRFYPKCL